MHTYMKHEDGTYSVGQWLPNREGITSFHKMFDVKSRYAAMAAVNMLNGGDMLKAFEVVKEH